MSIVTTDSANYSAIAGAIREKLGVQTTYRPNQMAAAIESIPTGGEPVLETLNATANGTYTPGTGVDGFSSVVVAVDMGGGLKGGGSATFNYPALTMSFATTTSWVYS